MKINLAHVRERSVQGGWIDILVFEADATDRSPSGRARVLADLTRRARANRVKVDQSAIAFVENAGIRFYGDANLVDYLSKNGVPAWTHQMDI